MSKYLVFLLVAALCLSLTPMVAQDAETPGEPQPPADQPEQPTINPMAQTFVDRATSFIDAHASDLGNFNRDQYVDAIDTAARQIPVDADLSNFNVASYMDGLENKVDQMLASFNGAQDSGSLKQEYLEEISNFFIKEYGEDMKNGVTNISTADYLNDLTNLNNYYQSRLDGLNGSGAESGGPTIGDDELDFDPTKSLDRALKPKRETKIEFFWGGIQNTWLNYNLVSLVNAFQNRYSHDSVAQTDFQFLQDLWPQSAEVYMMNTAYNNGDYYITDANDPNARRDNVVIDEYGMPMGDGSYDPTQFDVGGNTTNLVTASYNNRQWGYVNGTFNTVSITTNGRKYTLQEHFYTSPLVLDMDGDDAIQASNGKWLPHRYTRAKMAEFDISGDGFVDITEWVGPTDGLLLVYKEGQEVSANELFGNAGGFDHGYEKLSLFDKNGDRQISGEELSTLSVWQDSNGNAKVDKGEVASVQSLGITMISLQYDDNLVSQFVQNGKTKKVYDWYPSVFAVKKRK